MNQTVEIALYILAFAVALGAAMACAWGLVLRTGQSGFADVFWSYSIGVVGVAAALMPMDPTAYGFRHWLVAGLVAVWSLRLGTHILMRSLAGGDDPRYAQLKSEWGDKYPANLLLFLEIQAAAGLVLVVSAMAAANNPAPFGWLDALAIAIAVIAIAGEAISDMQLNRFKADPANKGKVCDVGLWGLSRHPNYFFEWLYWLALPFFALGHPIGWIAFAAPALMYWLLVYVSGVPPLEAHMLRSRPDAFARYQQRVRAFWPIPKSASGAPS